MINIKVLIVPSFCDVAQHRTMIESSTKDTQNETMERKKLEHYERDKIAMKKLQKRYNALCKQLDTIQIELDAKILHCEKITEERNELRQKFEEMILDVQQKSSMLQFSMSSFEKFTEIA